MFSFRDMLQRGLSIAFYWTGLQRNACRIAVSSKSASKAARGFPSPALFSEWRHQWSDREKPPFSFPSWPSQAFQAGFSIQKRFLYGRPIRRIKEQLKTINYLPKTFFQSVRCTEAKSLSLHFPCEGGSGQIKHPETYWPAPPSP